jgi:tetratricopeptide (TPR) repeat protein
VLVLADNARDAAQVRPLLPPPGCLLLVTSRTRFALAGLMAIDLDCLAEPEAVELIKKICPRIGGQAAAIARKCGRFPLALRAAASLLEVHGDIDPADYLRDLSVEADRLKTIGAEGVEMGVEGLLNLSYRQLPAAAQRVFCELAVFPGDFDAAAAVAVCGDEGKAHLGTLFRYSLVEFGQQAGRYRLHDFTRLFAATRLDDPAHGGERLPAEERHAGHFCRILAAANELYEKGNENIAAGLGLFERERANIEAGQAWSARHAATSDAAARLTNDYPDAGLYVIELRLHPHQGIGWLLAAVAAARRLQGRQAEGRHLGNLGIAYDELREPCKAIEYYERALPILGEIGDRNLESIHSWNLGLALVKQGERERGLALMQVRVDYLRDLRHPDAERSAAQVEKLRRGGAK